MKALKPFLKWPGGKQRELVNIMPLIPKKIDRFFEPFVGGGAVYFATEAQSYFINDKSYDLIGLYKTIKNDKSNEFSNLLTEVNDGWVGVSHIAKTHDSVLRDFFLEIRVTQGKLNEDLISMWVSDNFNGFVELIPNVLRCDLGFYQKELRVNLLRKMQRMYAIEKKKHVMPMADVDENIETALKSAFYMYFRHLLNNWEGFSIGEAAKNAVYFFIRNYSYSSMFRYNSQGGFNVPYGGIGYNGNNLKAKIEYLKSNVLSEHLMKTEVSNLDFEDFFIGKNLEANDFIFLDPPYDTDFSTYDKNVFSQKDQKRLADFLTNQVKCKWMMVIKDTEFIYSLYKNKGLFFGNFDKNYAVSFMNRNGKEASHLIITNYQTQKSFAQQA